MTNIHALPIFLIVIPAEAGIQKKKAKSTESE